MKKLTQISLVLFFAALTFSSCEEDNVLQDTALIDDRTEIVNPENSVDEDSNSNAVGSYDARKEVSKEDR